MHWAAIIVIVATLQTAPVPSDDHHPFAPATWARRASRPHPGCGGPNAAISRPPAWCLTQGKLDVPFLTMQEGGCHATSASNRCNTCFAHPTAGVRPESATAPIHVSRREADEHAIGDGDPWFYLRVPEKQWSFFSSIRVTVVVDTTGAIISSVPQVASTDGNCESKIRLSARTVLTIPACQPPSTYSFVAGSANPPP